MHIKRFVFDLQGYFFIDNKDTFLDNLMLMKTLFWFRQDLRLSDNPGLFQAAQQGSVLPVFILDEENAGIKKMGAASRWWLHHSLEKLSQNLCGQLNIYAGNALTILLKIIQENAIEAVFWNRCYEPWRIKQDTHIKKQLNENAIFCQSFNACLLWEPWQVLKDDHTPYKVYTPYYRKTQTLATPMPLPKPEKLNLIKDVNTLLTLPDLALLPEKTWYQSFEPCWMIGEKAAHEKLDKFLNQGIQGYKEKRDYPAQINTSGLSPHLHFGEISPRQIWASVNLHEMMAVYIADQEHFKRELVWREFSYYLLYHFPNLPEKNFQPKFNRFPWKNIENPETKLLLKQWQKGQTGYPIVDAGMRELWQTGYMHNRVRMIVASFLVKNLLIHWHEGEKWFWDCLVDADLASNSASWQWVAGSGVDAAPYFRIFNPVTQGEKFDAEGEYTKKFVPELAKLPNKYLFKPWEAPQNILNAAGVFLGKNYPKPIIDLKTSREEALNAYQQIR